MVTDYQDPWTSL